MSDIMQEPKITIQDADICRKFLEIILDIKIQKVEYPEGQKIIDLSKDAKSVRLDVYVEDDANTIYDVEMQTTTNRNLPKRSRYYQGMIDLDHLRRGMDYTELKKSLVIFICPFDPFKKGEYLYCFRHTCHLSDGSEFELGDETEKIFVNAAGTKGAISNEFKDLMEYIKSDLVQNAFTKQLDREVLQVNSNEKWRLDRMTLAMRLNDKLEEGKAIGKELTLFESVANIMNGFGVTEEAAMTVLKFTDAQKADYEKWKATRK